MPDIGVQEVRAFVAEHGGDGSDGERHRREERGEGGADGQAGGGRWQGGGVEGRAVEKPRIRGGDEVEGGIGKAGRGGDGGAEKAREEARGDGVVGRRR